MLRGISEKKPNMASERCTEQILFVRYNGFALYRERVWIRTHRGFCRETEINRSGNTGNARLL